MAFPSLDTINNCIQVLQWPATFYGVWKFGQDLMRNHKISSILLFGLLSLLCLASLANFADKMGWLPKHGLINETNCEYHNERVIVDNHAFFNCKFDNVKLVYNGGPYIIDSDTKFLGFTDFEIGDNAAANNVVGFMLQFKMITKQPQASIHLRPNAPQ